jgi:hypothetical protein
MTDARMRGWVGDQYEGRLEARFPWNTDTSEVLRRPLKLTVVMLPTE